MSKWHAIVVTVLAGMLAALAARGQAQTPAYEIVVSTGHRADVTRVALALGGTLLASSAGSQSKLWDVATGHLLRNNEGGLLAISADGRRMLAGSTTGKTLRLSDPGTYRRLHSRRRARASSRTATSSSSCGMRTRASASTASKGTPTMSGAPPSRPTERVWPRQAWTGR